MAISKKTVTLDNLAALGVERLAEILVALADDDAEVKRRLRLELAAQVGGDSIAAEISKRIAALKSARSFVDWRKQRDFVRDLDLQRAMIVDRIAPSRPDLALDLIWRFLDLAEPTYSRVDDSNGAVGDVFRSACEELGPVAVEAEPEPVAFADRVFGAVLANDYGVYDGLVAITFPALSKAGVAHLKGRLEQVSVDRKAGVRDGRADAARRALQDIADGQGDVDAFIALVPADERSFPHRAVGIGRRLLTAGRAPEALAALEAARPRRQRTAGLADDDASILKRGDGSSAWENAYIDALDAASQPERAQRLRWSMFERQLSAEPLRAYLKRLPDFDDVEAEERAMQHALGFASFATALHFFSEWPDPTRAAQLVLTRAAEIDGDLYFLLEPAAQMIEGKHPLAATLLRRAMIADTLGRAKSTRYKHAVRHLVECTSLVRGIGDFGAVEAHDDFVRRLRSEHGRKVGFWSQLAELSGNGGPR